MLYVPISGPLSLSSPTSQISTPLPSQQRDLPQAPYQLVAISLGPFPWLSFPSERTPALVTLYICLVLSES